MGSTFGRYLRVTTFGESHGPGVGAVIDGFPAGVQVRVEDIQEELDKRRPGTSKMVSPRKEPDRVEFLSGIAQGVSLGSPISLLVRNENARSQDYESIQDRFRPGHADYTYFKKYGISPQPGGGRSSGRETIGRVAAGALAKILLRPLGVDLRAATVGVGPITAKAINYDFADSNPLRFADPDLYEEAAELVHQVRSEGDSIGGRLRVTAIGVPAGWGDPVFDKLEASLGQAMLSIGAVKGIQFGAGFELCKMRGSEANDELSGTGFLSNRAGGTLGGISTGEPIVFDLAIKPTSSIAKEQRTQNLAGEETTIRTHGRHDPCLCPRICPVAEAMTCLVLADAYLEQKAHGGIVR